LTIFSRLMLSYFALLVMATAVSAYSIIQLGQMRGITHSIILHDTNMLDLHKNMADALLSASRYEKNIAVMWDPALYQSFLISKKDFERYFEEARGLVEPGEMQEVLIRLERNHRTYQSLIAEDVALLEAGKPLPENRSGDDKEQVLNRALEDLTQLRALIHHTTFSKVKTLDEAGVKAQTMAVVITAIAFLLGLVLSISITRSIVLPLSRMKKKTVEIAAGKLEPDLELPSPPEVGALAQAFNTMCARLKEVDRMKTEFFSLMSHELRTPLTSIREGTNLFLEGKGGEVTDKQRKLLTIVAEESNRLIRLVNSLLDLSRLEAGMVPFHFTEYDLPPLINRTLDELMPLAESRGIRLEKDIGEVPRVAMDSERIRQVLRNLLGNALKFTPHGGSVRVEAQLTADGLRVSITDTGPGIPREHIGSIFEKFRQVSPADSRRLEGTGLGLAIVKHIVHAHGGSIWAESEAGHGSTFIFVDRDFQGALRESRKVLDLYPHSPPGDAALYEIGMIHVHPDNPKSDPGKALQAFTRLTREFPRSPRAEEARSWIHMLQVVKKTRGNDIVKETRGNDIEAKETVREPSVEQGFIHLLNGQQLLVQGDIQGALQANLEALARSPHDPPGDEALFAMGLIHIHYANPKKDIRQAQALFARIVKEFPDSPRTEEARIWVDILDTMEKTRQIDIEIEEKKREMRR